MREKTRCYYNLLNEETPKMCITVSCMYIVYLRCDGNKKLCESAFMYVTERIKKRDHE